MRKHDVRKWIHAVLDMLPLFIIPIFAIYMRNENSTRDISVDYQINKIVNFNQYSDYEDYGSYSSARTSTSYVNGVLQNKVVQDGSGSYQYGVQSLFTIPINANDVILFRYSVYSDANVNQFGLDRGNFIPVGADYYDSYTSGTIQNGDFRFTASFTGSVYIIPRFNGTFVVDDVMEYYSLQWFNLTQMFGNGNEPSTEDFNSWYPNTYTYNTGTKQLLNIGTETYNNTDVGSQMMYSLYTPVKEYFNLNNVANFGGIFDWLQLNFFNGTAPMSVFIVWNIILYEFIMDILFLIYAVFMFIIDFVECLIDKAFGKSYRGGR